MTESTSEKGESLEQMRERASLWVNVQHSMNDRDARRLLHAIADDQAVLLGMVERLTTERNRLRTSLAAALESAEEEGVDHHRGTDDPRRFVTILREALGAGAGGGDEPRRGEAQA